MLADFREALRQNSEGSGRQHDCDHISPGHRCDDGHFYARARGGAQIAAGQRAGGVVEDWRQKSPAATGVHSKLTVISGVERAMA